MRKGLPNTSFLPFAFVAVLFGGYPVLEYVLTALELRGHDPGFWIIAIIVLVDSVILNFWLLSYASGQPAYKSWKAVLALYLTIILPGSIAFSGTMLIVLNLGGDSNPIYIPITWMLIAYILLWGSYQLLRSRLFTPFIGDRFGAWHVRLQLAAGLTVFLLYALFFISAFAV
ncbi:MAG: hypothetical protein HOL66_07365 [Rhodospirillaceae bacterium]|jgi:hypothetical protein|nr:hypothetical protein [Rhodospirillaceae bacterium]MBT5244047.1 hypothetical protein [Rhodospirillaceae bacterium]MBT5560867.1 hypothetical protein [Rhodospirillaceae bacterium]MBT6241156.1 hypothetical protein [Rhodospirillaceae bacterium]MBT7138326.1 hypothetical protein [Rhodospirillaceae bacterium]